MEGVSSMQGWVAGLSGLFRWPELQTQVVAGVLQLLKLAAVYLLLRWTAFAAIRRVSRPVKLLTADPVRARRIETLASLGRSTVSYALAVVFGILALKALGVDPMPLITAAGVAGLAIGFGAQRLVRDVIGGFFILLENQFGVGEIITVGAVTGTVCEIGLRTTRIRDPQGRLYILSNGDITLVCNHSRGEVIVSLEVNVAASADLERASAVLDEAGAAVSERHGLSSAFRSQGISAFDASKVTLKLVGSVPPSEQEQVLGELREEIFERLRREGVPVV